MNNRAGQIESVKQTAEDLLENASDEDRVKISQQQQELTDKWEKVLDLSRQKALRLADALKQVNIFSLL